MVEESRLKECSYFLVRYVPDIVRDEFLNICLFLHSPEEEFLDCLFTDDFRRIKRFHPQADTRFLRELQAYFEQQIKEHEANLPGLIQEMRDSYSNLIQLSEPRACLLHDPQAQMPEMFARYVGARVSGAPAPDTRMRIKQRLTEALKLHGVFDHPRFEKRVPATRWTGEGDPFTFDFGYRPLLLAGKPNGHIKLIHALSLKNDPEIADLLSLKMERIRRQEPAELTAVVEALADPRDRTATYAQGVLQESRISLQPLSEVDAYSRSLREELGAV